MGHIRKDGTISHTLTSVFLLPTVGVNLRSFGRSFINAYIDEQKFISVFVVCHNNENDPELLSSIVRARINPNFIETETIEDEIIIKFKIPQDYYNVYKLFIDGKYSKFPNDYKDILVRIYGKEVVQDNYTATEYNILFPQDYKRKQIAKRLGVDWKLIHEVIDIPDLKYETYKTINELELDIADDSKQ